MWFRLRIDVGYGALARAALFCLSTSKGEREERELCALWPGPHRTGCFLSVRSGFDLLLSALELPAGSEVLMSAVTIPDMVELVRAHGLVPVPVDVIAETGRVDEDALRSSITDRTRVLLLTQLFGDVAPLEGVLSRIRGKGILLVEDCAQAFSGLRDQLGHPSADVSMFSFGIIKTATALGGAVFNVRDPELLRRMRERQASWPAQGGLELLRRVLTVALMRLVTGPRAYSLLTALTRLVRVDLDGLLVRGSRGFRGVDRLRRIRRRPSGALLGFLLWRLRHLDEAPLEERRRNGDRLAWLLGLPRPSCTKEHRHGWWLFPVLTDRPEELGRRLREAGFDTSAGHSLTVVATRTPGDDRGARELLERVLFVPVHAGIPPTELDRLANVIVAHREDDECAAVERPRSGPPADEPRESHASGTSCQVEG